VCCVVSLWHFSWMSFFGWSDLSYFWPVLALVCPGISLCVFCWKWYLCSEPVPSVLPQLHEESSGRTVYQPSVRILKRDRTADAAHSTNQSAFGIIISLYSYLAEIYSSLFYCLELYSRYIVLVLLTIMDFLTAVAAYHQMTNFYQWKCIRNNNRYFS